MMANRVCWMIGCVFLAGCATTSPAPNEEVAAKQAEFEHGSLLYLDSDTFDQNLSKSLNNSPGEVRISLIDVDVNEIPDRLDKWLSVVANSKGYIDMTASSDQPMGGFSVQTLALAYKAYDFSKKWQIYRPANKYNVRVEYMPGDGQVNSIVFVPKEEYE